LSTVYGIVQQWHGGLTVTSHVGQGSTFSIYLPYSGDAAAASASSTRGAGGSETILIVEDEEEVRVTSQRMIRAAGYDVFAVANASEALLVLEHHDHQIDLLLTDVVMPGMSGPELVEQVAAQRPEIAVLYMSGHSDNPALLRSISEAERRLITKPFSAAELTQAVRLALDSRAAATAGAAE
jgi:CheY-like chemotaxis protein